MTRTSKRWHVFPKDFARGGRTFRGGADRCAAPVNQKFVTALVATFLAMIAAAPVAGADPTVGKAAVLEMMKRTADWQLAHPSPHLTTDWTQVVFYTGALELAELDPSGPYLRAVRSIGDANRWRPGPQASLTEQNDADYGVMSTYAELYRRYKEPEMIGPAVSLFDGFVDQPMASPLLSDDALAARDFAMSDSLFFGPPALAAVSAATGDQRYLDLADQMWWKSSESLYDSEENLYYRDSRYIDQREGNGQKVFWSRGNAWVFAGLARMLQDMPPSYPDRARYEGQFKEMAARLVGLQGADGYWRSSLLDPASTPNPESSGTALFTYGLAWGINHGQLDKGLYGRAARGGWAALVKAVQPDGMLGWVQRQAEKPENASSEDTEVYGVGALLLAGAEMYPLQS